MSESKFRERLRSATAEAHEEMERSAPMEEISSSLLGYYSFLQRLQSPWLEWEYALANTPLVHFGELRLMDRFRGKLLCDDLLNLRSRLRGMVGDSLTDFEPKSTERLNLPRAAGVLYVLEGARFGGRAILQRLAPLGVTPEKGGSFFQGYGNETGSMWASFLEWVEQHVPEADFDQSAEAAVDVFEAFTSAWLEPNYD